MCSLKVQMQEAAGRGSIALYMPHGGAGEDGEHWPNTLISVGNSSVRCMAQSCVMSEFGYAFPRELWSAESRTSRARVPLAQAP